MDKLIKLRMAEHASSSMDKLIKLLRVDQPLWIKSSTDEHYVLDYDCYKKIFSGAIEFKYQNSRMESSKVSGLVAMEATTLVDLYMDSDKWVELFPTVFSKSKTLLIIQAGMANRSGSLQLIRQQMHILSPLLQQREFYLLRYCQEVEEGTWAIVDVSYGGGGNPRNPLTCWKHPSGCMIQEMPNGMSKVTCVEHIEVGNDFLIHPIYEGLVNSTLAFGAKRWIKALQRMTERVSFLREAGMSSDDLGIGRRSMIVLATKMMKGYCSFFNFFGADCLQLSQLNNGVKIALRKNTCPDQPAGIVIHVASSFWVPKSPDLVFNFLNDHLKRSQWDILCSGGPVSALMQIPTGRKSSNVISILQPVNSAGDVMIFQESVMEQMGSLLVYAPVSTKIMLELATGVKTSLVQILASGFAVTPDGSRKAAPSTSTSKPRSSGSIVTASFQFLGCSTLSIKDVNMQVVTSAGAIVRRAVSAIKSACQP